MGRKVGTRMREWLEGTTIVLKDFSKLSDLFLQVSWPFCAVLLLRITNTYYYCKILWDDSEVYKAIIASRFAIHTV